MKVSNSSPEDFGDAKCWPPGFRFHPTDEELVLYYLKRKICRRRLRLNVIGELDVYKWEPEELPGLSVLKTGDRQWFFFSPRDRRYPNGGRVNRATRHGYWKATGKDRNITCNSQTVGVKKTLVFYKGRAPSGERTDWVMHEYTVDEEELKKCQGVQDSCALYKVFKKSGAGPKNGEQYGAPFREEEWADDDEPVDLVQQLTANTSVDSFTVCDQGQLPDNDVEEIWGRLANDPITSPPQIDDFSDLLCLVGEEVNLGNMVETSLREAFSTEPSTVLHPCRQQCDTQASLEATQSATSYLHSYDAPEVTSAPNISEQNHHRTKEEDFLEIDDLLGPEPSFPDMGYSGDNLRFKETDGLDGPDLYLDAAMFLHDMGPIDQGTTSQPYFDTLQVDMANQLNYQLPSQPDDADHISNQLWTHDQRSNVLVASGSNQVVMSPPTSGVVHVGSSTNIIETQQNQGNAGEASDSWFSSALWAFVESMPTPPASASENALINRAFERMSSFGRVRINARNTDVATGQATPAGRRVGGNRGFVFLSILGAICAVLWMLMIGTTVKVLKTFLGRFISS